jgi:heme iron utilization protein
MVPFAVEPLQGRLVMHVSGLAAHTRHLQQRPGLSLLVTAREVLGKPVHALPRITLNGVAEPLEPGSPQWNAFRGAYLKRFPEAEPMTQLGDFRFVAIRVTGGRHIAGFGAARDVDEDEIQRVLRAMT